MLRGYVHVVKFIGVMSTLQNSKGIMSTYAKRGRGDFVRGRGYIIVRIPTPQVTTLKFEGGKNGQIKSLYPYIFPA